jgi:hypothetical protein
MSTNLPYAQYLFYLNKASLRDKLILYFFSRPADESLHLRKIAVMIDADPAHLSRELRQLEKDGVFIGRKQGILKYFSLNPSYLFYEELKSMASKLHAQERKKEQLAVREESHLYSTAAPKVYIVAGPNGAGKTTFAKNYLPKYRDCKQFVNADLIAGGLAPFSPEQAAIQAGKLQLHQIHELSKKKLDFGFETTLKNSNN